MRILFVSSGNTGKINPIIKNQGDSPIKEGIEISYFLINGKGVFGYIRNIFKIRQLFKKEDFDLVHAHYSLSGFVASMAGRSPLIVSLMGSDVYSSRFWRKVIKIFSWSYWDITIVKTEKMKELMDRNNVVVIPNGVNLERFIILPMDKARKKIGFPQNRKLILFLADPSRPEKNYDLALKAVQLVDNRNAELLTIYNLPNEAIPYYLNAADLLLITSQWEGSVNVVKESLACNCPVISTNVGDIKWILNGIVNCHITSYNPAEIAEKIKSVLRNGRIINGREKIINLELDSVLVAKRIIQLYKDVLRKYNKYY